MAPTIEPIIEDQDLYRHLRDFHDLDIIFPARASWEEAQPDRLTKQNKRLRQIHDQDHKDHPFGMGAAEHLHYESLYKQVLKFARDCYEAGQNGTWCPQMPDAIYSAINPTADDQDAVLLVAKAIVARNKPTNQKINAIKELRTQVNMGLKEAKDIIDKAWIS